MHIKLYLQNLIVFTSSHFIVFILRKLASQNKNKQFKFCRQMDDNKVILITY